MTALFMALLSWGAILLFALQVAWEKVWPPRMPK